MVGGGWWGVGGGVSGGWRVETVLGEGVGKRGLGLGQTQVCAKHARVRVAVRACVRSCVRGDW